MAIPGVVQTLLAMEFNPRIVPPELKNRIFTEGALTQALHSLLKSNGGNWAVIQKGGYQLVIDFIFTHQKQEEQIPSEEKLKAQRQQDEAIQERLKSCPQQLKRKRSQIQPQQKPLMEQNKLQREARFNSKAFQQRLERLSRVGGHFDCDEESDEKSETPDQLGHDQLALVPLDQPAQAPLDQPAQAPLDQSAQAPPFVHRASPTLVSEVQAEPEARQPSPLKVHVPSTWGQAAAPAQANLRPPETPEVWDAQYRNLAQRIGALPSVVILGLPDGYTHEAVREHVARLFSNFELVPTYRNLVSCVDLYEGTAVVSFISDAAADIFLQGSSLSSEQQFSYCRNFARDRSSLRSAVVFNSQLSCVIYISSLSGEWFDREKLTLHFTQIVKSANTVHAVCLSEEASDGYLVFKNSWSADLVFERCMRDRSLLRAIGEHVFICRGRHTLPLIHFQQEISDDDHSDTSNSDSDRNSEQRTYQRQSDQKNSSSSHQQRNSSSEQRLNLQPDSSSEQRPCTQQSYQLSVSSSEQRPNLQQSYQLSGSSSEQRPYTQQSYQLSSSSSEQRPNLQQSYQSNQRPSYQLSGSSSEQRPSLQQSYQSSSTSQRPFTQQSYQLSSSSFEQRLYRQESGSSSGQGPFPCDIDQKSDPGAHMHVQNLAPASGSKQKESTLEGLEHQSVFVTAEKDFDRGQVINVILNLLRARDPFAILRITEKSVTSALVVLKSGQLVDNLMKTYLEHPELTTSPLALTIYRHIDWKRPRTRDFNCDVQEGYAKALFVSGYPKDLHLSVVKGILVELLKSLLARSRLEDFNERLYPRHLVINSRPGCLVAFSTSAQVDVLVSMWNNTDIRLAGQRIHFERL